MKNPDLPMREQVKKMAKTLQRFLAEKDEIHICLGHCYETLAKAHGYENWDTFSAVLKKNEEENS